MKRKNAVNLNGRRINYKVRRSSKSSENRIYVGFDGVTVVKPEGNPIAVRRILKEKSNWVLTKIKKYEKLRNGMPDREFEEGEEFPYLGEKLKLKLKESENKIEDSEIILNKEKVKKTSIKRQLRSLYIKKAKEIIIEKAEEHSEEVGVEYEEIKFRNQKTRWASCSSKRNLSFNWRLIMAPEDIIDYVIVHELVHLDEKNHSRAFWTKLGSFFPDYREKEEWLKENFPKLVFFKERFSAFEGKSYKIKEEIRKKLRKKKIKDLANRIRENRPWLKDVTSYNYAGNAKSALKEEYFQVIADPNKSIERKSEELQLSPDTIRTYRRALVALGAIGKDHTFIYQDKKRVKKE